MKREKITIGVDKNGLSFYTHTFDNKKVCSVLLEQKVVFNNNGDRKFSGSNFSSVTSAGASTITKKRTTFLTVPEEWATAKDTEAVLAWIAEQEEESAGSIVQILSPRVLDVLHDYYETGLLKGDYTVEQAQTKYGVVDSKTGEIIPGLYRACHLTFDNVGDFDYRTPEQRDANITSEEAEVIEEINA